MDIHTLKEFALFLGGAFLIVFVTHRLIWSFISLIVPENGLSFWKRLGPRAIGSLLIRALILLPPIAFFGLAEWYLMENCSFSPGFKTGLLIVGLLSIIGRYAARTEKLRA